MWVRTLTKAVEANHKNVDDHLTFLPWYVRIAVWVLAVSAAVVILALVT